MTDEERYDPNRWHLSKAVPVSIIFFLAAQTIGLVIWAVRLDARVDALEKGQLVQDARLVVLEQTRDRVIIIEERQNNVIKILESNGKKLDLLIDEYSRLRK